MESEAEKVPTEPSNKEPSNGQTASSPADELELKAQEFEKKYLYLYAEFENFKKRVFKERIEQSKYAIEPVAGELLQVLDNLNRALEHAPENTDKNLAAGLQMVVNQFLATLQKQGVQPIDCLGKPFDPNLEEAVGTEASDQGSGIVLKVLSAGYTLHGRLLRAARVVVSA